MPKQQITIDIVEKNGTDWRMIGVAPDGVSETGGLHVYRGNQKEGNPAVVRDSTTDEAVMQGRTLPQALQALANKTGYPVSLCDDARGGAEIRRFEPRSSARR